ncbi:hypothetical protein HYT60_01585, partial [Candidatus Woesebacteria bacterium]|nr:hypothetical protein [Candidatus Woesebacteria bacterium]
MKLSIKPKKLLLKLPIFIFTIFFLLFETAFPAIAGTATDTYTDVSKINDAASVNYTTESGALKMGFGTGDGADGPITLSANKNINTDPIAPGRTSADGVNYAVSAIGTNTATATTAPAGIAAGDEVLLINLQGDATNSGNAGNYEFLNVQSVSVNTITFSSNVQKIYGATTSNSTLTGQKIAVQRVPNYT